MMQHFTNSQPDRERVLYYYDELVKAGVQPSSYTYNVLMQAYGTIEPIDLKAMHRVFDSMVQKPTADAHLQGLHWATLINCHGTVAKGELISLSHLHASLISYSICWWSRPRYCSGHL